MIIQYIADNLDPMSFLLNFGVIAINEIHPKVMVRFTLKNVRNNLGKGWTQAIEGETLEDLFDSVYAAVEYQKCISGSFVAIFLKFFYFFVLESRHYVTLVVDSS